MRGEAAKRAESALALLDTISNPTRTKEALENFQKREFEALNAIREFNKQRQEIAELNKDLTERENALKALMDKQESDLSVRTEALTKAENTLKQNQAIYKTDSDTLNRQQNAFVHTGKAETDRIENHKRALSVREKKIQSLKALVEKQQDDAKTLLDQAKATKENYDFKAAELNRIITD